MRKAAGMRFWREIPASMAPLSMPCAPPAFTAGHGALPAVRAAKRFFLSRISLMLGRLKNGLKKGKDVTSALYEAGYSSSSRLYEGAPARLGMTPATYGRGGRSMRINYTIGDSPLGRLLVAATERGVCAVSLGDSD